MSESNLQIIFTDTDVKEQIIYLQELGVENFDVELPEFNNSNRNRKFQIRNRIKKFKSLPDDDILIKS